jgi:hypothetical protein
MRVAPRLPSWSPSVGAVGRSARVAAGRLDRPVCVLPQAGLYLDDPTLMRSDWYPWVSAHDWFDPTVELQELYARQIEEFVESRERRRQLLPEPVVVSPDRASSGYRALASLVGKRRIHTILTPNFETPFYDSFRRDPSASSIIQIQLPAQVGLISTDPAVSQGIHVLMDKNMPDWQPRRDWLNQAPLGYEQWGRP